MQIQKEVNDILHSHFEIPHSKLVPEAHLFADLGLDSLDAADLLVLLEAKSGLSIIPDTFMVARTLDDVYRLVTSLFDSAEGESEIDSDRAVRQQPEASESVVLRSR